MHVRIRSTTDGESLDYEMTGTGRCTRAGTEPSTIEHDLDITGGEADDPINYEIRVTGTAERDQPDDDARDGYIDGAVAGAADAFTFTGKILDFQADGAIDVTIDGESVDHTTLGVDVDGVTHLDGEWTAYGSTDGNANYTVDGDDTDVSDFQQTGGDSDWVLEFDGEPVAFGGPDAEPGAGFGYATKQQIRSFVECYVEDVVRYGDVESLVAEVVGNMDGVSVPPDGGEDGSDDESDESSGDGESNYDDTPEIEHRILVEGGSQETHVPYTFSVSGKVDAARRANPDDRVYADSVAGEVRGSGDSYTFTGEITEFETTHPDLVTVTIDSERVGLENVGE